jgi:MFS family permease
LALLLLYLLNLKTPDMNIFEKLSNGWTLSMNSLKVLKENKQLIIFPLLSGISMILIIGSFFVAMLASADWQLDGIHEDATWFRYGMGFLFYIINYFVVVFFNTALIQCTRDYFNGEKPSVKKGIQFSLSRLGAIFTWSVFAATVGFILRVIQENLGSLGKIITGLIGMVWGIATFFVVPIIAYENLSPLQAVKRSVQLMKEKWGESLGSTFSFGLLRLLAFVIVCVPLFALGYFIHPLVGLTLAVLGLFFVISVMSAAQTIFISAVYHNMNGDPVKNFDEKFAENLFRTK